MIGITSHAWSQTDSFGDSGNKNDACIKCHDNQQLVGSRNYINMTRFGHTTHAKFGCSTCHDAITGNHPDGNPVARTTTCGDCHNEISAQYSASIHGSRAKCNGCHNPHKVYTSEEISADDMNKQCANCHDKIKITASHSKWLPQTDKHLGSITCVTCHSKAENFVITIYIAKHDPNSSDSKLVLANFDDLKKMTGNENVQYLIDKNQDNYISLDELRAFNRNSANKELYLKAILTPVKPTHSFQTFDNRWDCTACHASGPEVMQTSFVAFPEKNGTFRRESVEKGAAMDALMAIPNFYLMGSTRNESLNKIGLLIIVGGMVMPVGHGFLRFLSRKNRL
jgi:predicted CXXCH cytochrome family protein